MESTGSRDDLHNGQVPFKMRSFLLDGIGGGLVVVNHYGEFTVSAAHVDFGCLGVQWYSLDEATLYLHRKACNTKAKCSFLPKLGSAGILVYFNTPDVQTNYNRKKLLSALSLELLCFTKTNMLCIPGDLQTEDLSHIYQESRKLQEFHLNSSCDDEEKKSPGDLFSRSRSHSKQRIIKAPIPQEILNEEFTMSNVVPKSAAFSSLGSILTLMKAKRWANSNIALLGISSLSLELYHLLTRETDKVLISDPSPNKLLESSRIPPRAYMPWEEVFAVENQWDIIVLCSRACPTFTAEFIDTIQCKAIVSLSDDFSPVEQEERDRSILALEEKEIFEALDGLIDLGGIAKVFALSNKSDLSFKETFELGSRVMQKKLSLHDVVANIDVDNKRVFHDLMNRLDGNPKLLGLETVMHQSTDQMFDLLWKRVNGMCPAFRALSSQIGSAGNPVKAHYLNVGAGNGAAARHICKQNKNIHVTCMDICQTLSSKNRTLSDEHGLGRQIDVHLGSFQRLRSHANNWFDGCICQESFFHKFDKFYVFKEAFRVTKGGGWLVIFDLMRGDAKGDGNEEIDAFVKEYHVDDWITSHQCINLARKAGWTEAQFTDCTDKTKSSLHGHVKKIENMIESNNYTGRNLEILKAQRLKIIQRIGQADQGIFKWGMIAVRKPFDVMFLSMPPVVPQPQSMIKYSVKNLDEDLKFGIDVLVVNIKEKLTREMIMALPNTTRLIVTLSSGLDHICIEAAEERGIRVRRAGRSQIVKSVADYLLANIIFGLRNGFQNVGVPFPGASWDLSWNSDGVDLNCSKIGFIGMGAIAIETAKKIRTLSNSCDLVYHIPKDIRCRFIEGTYQMRHIGIADLLSTCDVVVPMCPLTPATTSLINYSSFTIMKDTAIFINMARGKVVETAGMLRALKEGLIRHAILDTTDPEPLPLDHELWNLNNCTITPHFATNTTYVRKELVEDISNQIADTLDERGNLRLEEQQMRVELSEAYRITRDFGMDELVWNHISVLLSDGSFLITPGSRMFDDIGPQDLVKSSGNITADVIHQAVYNARSDIKAVVHLHTPATTAVSCLAMGFMPLAQEAAPFIGSVARLPWSGQSNDYEEQAVIGSAIKDKNVNTLLMENHGFCTFGKTLGEAWVLAYYFDKSCQTQLSCLQTGQKIKYPDEKVLAHAAKLAVIPEFLPGNCEWEALRKMLTRRHLR